MKILIYLILLSCLLSMNFVAASDQQKKIIYLKSGYSNSLFKFPTLELLGEIAEDFDFYDAKYISGITCGVKYKGEEPLSKKVYFSEFDKTGKRISEKTELIISKIGPGERGFAIFRIHGNPARIVIWGE